MAASQLLGPRTLCRFAICSRATCGDRRTATVQQGLFTTVEVTLPVFQQIFRQFQHVANAEGRLPPAKHRTVHHIKTTGPPTTSRFRRLDAAKLVAAKADYMKLERDGIIRRSSQVPGLHHCTWL
jgi:hypothetical protein